MSELLKRCFSTVVVLLVVLTLPALSPGQETALDLFIDGVEAFDFGDYETAVGSLKKAVELEPENLEYQYYLGLTHSAMDHDDEALEVFKSIVEKAPAEGLNAYFEMAAIYTKQGKHDKALDVLNLAQEAAPENPRVYFEKGLVYKNLADYETAVDSLSRAKTLDASLAQVADYNIAGVYFAEGKLEQAEQTFEGVIAAAPETVVAENARQSLENLERAKKARRPWYVWATLAWGYDTNVPLDSRDGVAISRLEGQPDDDGDPFQIFQCNGGYKIVNRPDFELGVGYQLRTTGYKNWTDYNLFANRPYAFLRYESDPVIFRFMYEPAWYYEGGSDDNFQDEGLYLTFGSSSEKFLQLHSFRPSVTILEPYDLQTSITADYQIRDYSDSRVYGLDSDSDLYSVSIVQSYRIPNTNCYPSIGYKYLKENADDSKESFHYNAGVIGVSSELFWKIWANLSMSYAKIEFNRNTDYKENGKRDDDQWQFSGSLRRALTDHFYLSFYYSYTDNDSNVSSNGDDPWAFGKSVYAGLLTFSY